MDTLNVQTSSLSVVIPTYNSAPWLPTTINALRKALVKTSWKAEVIIVDDGSTDDSVQVLNQLAVDFPYPFRVISQANQGRFMARWTGANAAQFPNMLLLDSRIPLGENALAYVESRYELSEQSQAWNGCPVTDPSASLIGHFWEVPTFAFWGEYLRNRRPMLITQQNFNKVPKGTTYFLCPTALFIECSIAHWPAENAALTNDDTKIIRSMVERVTVVLDPGFEATYRPRTNFRAFTKHSFARGTTLVDGFAGLNAVTNVTIGLLGIVPAALIVLIAMLALQMNIIAIGLLLAGGFVALCIPALLAARNKCPGRGISSYFVYSMVFAIPYWAGICRGLWVHRSAIIRVNRLVSGRIDSASTPY